MFEALLLAAAAPDPVLAPPPASVVMPPVLVQTPWPAPAPWFVATGPRFCLAIQRSEREIAKAAVLLDARDGKLLMAVAPGLSVKLKQPETIELRLDGLTFTSLDAIGYRPDPVNTGFIVTVDDAFIDAFAAARTLRVLRGGRELLSVDLAGSAATMNQLRRCYDSLRADLAARPQVSAPPPSPMPRKGPAKVVASNQVVTEDDYPIRAQIAGIEGSAVVRIEVGSDGTAGRCEVVTSSGNADLDLRSCALLKDRLRYLPALDASGKPYPSRYRRTFTWRLVEGSDDPSALPAQ